MQRIAMLGGGFIGRFYAESLHGQRSRDKVIAIYARQQETAQKFADDYGYWFSAANMESTCFRYICGYDRHVTADAYSPYSRPNQVTHC